MKGRRFFASVTIVFFLLIVAVGLSQAQGPGGNGRPPQGSQPQGEVSIAASVSSKFSYQGVLKEGGSPVTGSRDMTFRLYSDSGCTAQVGSDIVKSGVPVSEGLFSVELSVDQGLFNGQGLWLEAEVGGTKIGCQEILAVPYALSLRPSAVISGSVYDQGVLRVFNTDASNGGGSAISAVNYSGYTWRPAIYGENKGASAGVYGRSDGWHATVGWALSEFAGVFGHNGAGGYGGHFQNTGSGVALYASSWDNYTADLVLGGTGFADWEEDGRILSDPAYPGSDIFLVSNDGVVVGLDENNDEEGHFQIWNGANTTVFQVDEAGDASQPRTGNGLVKAAVYADCNKHSPSVVQSFSTLGTPISVSNTAQGDGTCVIDFGFNIADRFFTATATGVDYEVGHPDTNIRGVTCNFDTERRLYCVRWNGNTGTPINGTIMVVIY